MSELRVGIVGVGGMALNHVKSFSESDQAKIVALADTSPERLKIAKERFPAIEDASEYCDYKDMLAAGGLDAVNINTPHTLHFEQIMAALEAGLHVLCEKPLVCTTPHAKVIIDKAEQVGKTVMIAYQRHFQPPYRFIKQMVESGKIGEVTFVTALQSQSWKRGVAGSWRMDPALSGGGQLNDSGSHLIDVILWTTGLTAESVHAFIDHCGTPVDINSALAIKFTNGAQGTISVVGDSVSGFYEDYTVWGTRGIIFYRNGKLSICDEEGQFSEPKDLPEAGSVVQGFIDTISAGIPNPVPPQCGLRVIELTEAAWKSGEKCGPCEVASL